jgi:hypothetical protein
MIAHLAVRKEHGEYTVLHCIGWCYVTGRVRPSAFVPSAISVPASTKNLARAILCCSKMFSNGTQPSGCCFLFLLPQLGDHAIANGTLASQLTREQWFLWSHAAASDAPP